MINFIVKLIVKSNIHKGKKYHWGLFETLEQKTNWIAEKNQEKHTYNQLSLREADASWKDYSFTEYTLDTFLELDTKELEGLPLKHLMQILNKSN